MGYRPARTLTFDDPPRIQVRRQGEHLVFIWPCPFCGRRHYHGAKGGLGHRAAHCPTGTPGSERGYHLVVSD